MLISESPKVSKRKLSPEGTDYHPRIQSCVKIYGHSKWKSNGRLSLEYFSNRASLFSPRKSHNSHSMVETLPEPIKKVIEEKFTVRKLSKDEETIKNRVRLLKKENDKMLRKITEANSRAERIFEAKMRNE